MVLKICVYAIALNEQENVERFCLSAKDADLIVVADTGSTDETVSRLKACGAVVHDIRIHPWRFDDARNAALSLVPHDVDVCISLDLDEVLQPGWREELERLWAQDTTRLRYLYDWGEGISFQYEKVHARFGYRWKHACHEYPAPDRIEEVWAQTDKLLVVHKADPSKSRGQYLDLLQVAVSEDPNCPRTAFYFARELYFRSAWSHAISECERYLGLPGAKWPQERSYAFRVMGKCHEALGDVESALTAYRKAAAEAPYTREPHCDLALLCYRVARWQECFGAAISALAIVDRKADYTCDVKAWGSLPHDLASVSAYRLGLLHEALRHARVACEIEPGDARLAANVVEIERSIAA